VLLTVPSICVTMITIYFTITIKYAYAYIPLTLYPRGVAEASQIIFISTFYKNYLAMRNTADVTSGKPNAV
jgi:hypothetical protein